MSYINTATGFLGNPYILPDGGVMQQVPGELSYLEERREVPEDGVGVHDESDPVYEGDYGPDGSGGSSGQGGSRTSGAGPNPPSSEKDPLPTGTPGPLGIGGNNIGLIVAIAAGVWLYRNMK
jgi:hypothetical protein